MFLANLIVSKMLHIKKLPNLPRNRLKSIATSFNLKPNPTCKWKSVVGLEVHAQIFSESKLFSRSSTGFGIPLNSSVSYFDAAIPGTLPVLNYKCVEAGIKTALALDCRVNEISMFDRKHYFYADLPSGYQITQQHAALANNGKITFPVIVPGKKIYYKTARLFQLQLEQDSGKSLHDDKLRRSLVDLNRAGYPLMELVFAPDLETGEEAASLIKELTLILKQLGTCSCKMEEGALRVDANVSVHKPNEPLGVRTEIKNIGSVRNISQAITYEINRQLDIVENGGMITNETRSWDAEKKITNVMRDKEVIQDYRYMPDPNLPPLRLNLKESKQNMNISISQIAAKLPELPERIRQRITDNFGLELDVAIKLVNEPILLKFFLNIQESLTAIPNKRIVDFLINDFLAYCNKINLSLDDCMIDATDLKDILKSLHAEEINLQAARKLIELMHRHPRIDINTLIKDHNLKQLSNITAIESLCKIAIENQPKSVQQYQNGKSKALFSIAGEVFKLSNEKANMKLVISCLNKLLKTSESKE